MESQLKEWTYDKFDDDARAVEKWLHAANAYYEDDGPKPTTPILTCGELVAAGRTLNGVMARVVPIAESRRQAGAPAGGEGRADG